jgi:hypothetical protein
MKYIFIKQNSNERGGITTLSEHFHEFEPNSIILNLNAEGTDLNESRWKFVSAEVSHQPEEISKVIDSLVRSFTQEQFLLIPNYGQIAHASAALTLAKNKNCRILGIGHNNQEASYEILGDSRNPFFIVSTLFCYEVEQKLLANQLAWKKDWISLH